METAVNISFSCGHLKPSAQQLYLTEHTTPESCLQRLDMHRLIILHVMHCSAIQYPSYCNTVVTATNHTAAIQYPSYCNTAVTATNHTAAIQYPSYCNTVVTVTNHTAAIHYPSFCNTVVTTTNHTPQDLCTFSLLNVRLCTGSLLNVRWGADKSLARPGRKQATATKLGIYSKYSPRSSINFLARCSNVCNPLKMKIRRLSFQPGFRGSNDLCVGRKMATFQLFFQSRE